MLRVEFPSLYIYSRSDLITQFEPLHELVTARMRMGSVVVVRAVFEESDHVQHMRAHPHEYTDAVRIFLSVVLGHSADSETLADQGLTCSPVSGAGTMAHWHRAWRRQTQPRL
jgi:hypothetical protein